MLVRLRSLRERAGISQKTLAEHIGVSQQSINKYENHKIEPDIGTLIRIADYFETSVDYIIGHSGVDRPAETPTACELSFNEMKWMEMYRKLSPKEKQSIVAVMENYLDHH